MVNMMKADPELWWKVRTLLKFNLIIETFELRNA